MKTQITYKNLLIIEDETALRELLASELEKKHSNLKCFQAGTIAQAEEIFNTNQIDLIISDLKLPDKDGLVFLDQIRSKNFYIPFIFMTGFADTDMAIKALKLGAYDIIEKPISIETINNVITNALKYLNNYHEIKNKLLIQSKDLASCVLLLKAIDYGFDNYHKIIPNEVILHKAQTTIFITEAISKLIYAKLSLDVLNILNQKDTLNNKEDKLVEVMFLISLMQAIKEGATYLHNTEVINIIDNILNILSSIRLDINIVNDDIINQLMQFMQDLLIIFSKLCSLALGINRN